MFNTKNRMGAALMVALLPMPYQLAEAQQMASGGPAPILAAAGEPPQVVVTGSRFNEPLDNNTPVGTQVITAEDIRRSGAITIYEALRRLGGVQSRSNLLGTSDDTIDLRGFGVTGDQNTLVLIDGVRVSENELQTARLSSVPLNSVERVEILRGSGTVQYGGGATAGVINVITKSALPGSKSFNIGALAGSYGTSDVRVDGGVAGDPLAILGGSSVALDFAANKGATQNYRLNNAARQENLSGRVRLIADSGEVGMRFASERSHARLPGALSFVQFQSDPRQASLTDDWADTDANRYSVYGSYRWDLVEFAADIYRRDKNDRFFNNFGGGANQFTRSGSSVDGASPRLRVTAPLFGMANQLVVGQDSSRWSYVNQQAQYFGFFGAPGTRGEADLGNGNLSYDERGRQTNQAVFFKDDFTLGKVRLSVGARRESMYQSTANPLNFVAFTEMNRKLHGEELGASWSFLPDWSLYGRAGNSYRIGNIDENRFRLPVPGFLQPQTSKDYETGVRHASRAWDVDLTVFEHHLENEILFVPANVAPPFGSNINLAPTERSGVEVRANWRPRADIDIGVFYTALRARFRSGSFGGADLTGREVPLVARERASLQANWRVTPVDSVNLGWQYVGSQIYDNDQANAFGQRIPSYSTVDAKYTRRVGNVDVSVIGTNLGNRGYFAYGIINGAGTSSNVYPERRRGLYVNVAAHF